MKRKDIENKLSSLQGDARTKLESNPVGAFFIGLIVGIALTWFRKLLVPALLLAAIAALVMWLLAEDEEEDFEEGDAVPTNAERNGSSDQAHQ